MTEKDQHEEDEFFEKNLREILSSGSNPHPKEDTSFRQQKPISKASPQKKVEYSPESKKLFWANLVRIIAFIVLMGLLALFVYQITSRG